MIRKEDAERLMVRLPSEVKAWLLQEATKNGASQNSEIIRSIRARMEQERRERAAS
jgi:predicted HicB family RNase H-like nuclease